MKTRAPGETTVLDARHAALVARDPSADGHFVYSVETTGVYCRPSCAARRPKRENIGFHATPADAERAGFRPCKRCRPDQARLAERQAARVAELCRLIEDGDPRPTLKRLAEHSGWSTFHTHRIFKAVTGVTPHAYARAHRAKRVRAALESSESITSAIYTAGYASSGRFYGEAAGQLGMTPTKYRSAGAGVDIRYAVGACSLGTILVGVTAHGVCAILLGDDPRDLLHDLERRFAKARRIADGALEELIAGVVAMVENPGLDLGLPLDIRGTAFQHRVWQALRRVPAGMTASYSSIADAIGAPTAVRAVARACAANAHAVAIPCHRVVRRDGDLSGYRWGVERKRVLLAREAVATAGGGGRDLTTPPIGRECHPVVAPDKPDSTLSRATSTPLFRAGGEVPPAPARGRWP